MLSGNGNTLLWLCPSGHAAERDGQPSSPRQTWKSSYIQLLGGLDKRLMPTSTLLHQAVRVIESYGFPGKFLKWLLLSPSGCNNNQGKMVEMANPGGPGINLHSGVGLSTACLFFLVFSLNQRGYALYPAEPVAKTLHARWCKLNVYK